MCSYYYQNGHNVTTMTAYFGLVNIKRVCMESWKNALIKSNMQEWHAFEDTFQCHFYSQISTDFKGVGSKVQDGSIFVAAKPYQI